MLHKMTFYFWQLVMLTSFICSRDIVQERCNYIGCSTQGVGSRITRPFRLSAVYQLPSEIRTLLLRTLDHGCSRVVYTPTVEEVQEKMQIEPTYGYPAVSSNTSSQSHYPYHLRHFCSLTPGDYTPILMFYGWFQRVNASQEVSSKYITPNFGRETIAFYTDHIE